MAELYDDEIELALDEDEDILADDLVHGLGLHIAEDAPAQGLVGHLAVSFGIVPKALAEGRVLHSHAHDIGTSLLHALSIV